MNRQEFEIHYQALLKDWSDSNDRRLQQDYVEDNLYRLPEPALRYIIKNAGNPFGTWLVERAIDIVSFEDIVLKGNSNE